MALLWSVHVRGACLIKGSHSLARRGRSSWRGWRARGGWPPLQRREGAAEDGAEDDDVHPVVQQLEPSVGLGLGRHARVAAEAVRIDRCVFPIAHRAAAARRAVPADGAARRRGGALKRGTKPIFDGIESVEQPRRRFARAHCCAADAGSPQWSR